MAGSYLTGVDASLVTAALVAVNGATGPSAVAQQDSVVLPVSAGEQSFAYNADGSGSQQGQIALSPSGVPSGDAASWVVSAATGSLVTLALLPGASVAAGRVYVVDGAGDVLASYVAGDVSLTWSNGVPASGQTSAPPAGLTVADTSGDSIVWNTDGSLASATGSHALADGALSTEGQIYALDGTGSVTGQGAGTNIAVLNSGGAVPDEQWGIVAGSADSVSVTGLAGSDFNGTATLTDIQQVVLGGSTYPILVLNGGATTTTLDDDGDLLAETASGGNTIDFQQDGTVYWHVAGPGDTATLSSGDTEIYMAGSAADYTESFDASTDTLTLTATAAGSTGTTTINLASSLGGGTGEVVFTDGTTLGLGDVGDEVEYATTSAYGNLSKRFTLDGGDQTLHGTGASTIANFTSGDATPDDSWDIYQDAAGDVVMDGTDAGYDGVATMSGVAAAVLGYAGAGTGTAYSLAVTPAGGGSVTVGNPAAIGTSPIVTPAATILAERYGATDTVTLSSAHTVYWQVNGTNDTVHLNAGLTELYLPGDQADYALTYNASTGTATLVDSVTGRTGTLTIDGSARAELNFADGQVTDLNNTTADADLSRTLIGLGAYADPASWFFSAGAGGAIVADGTNDGYGATTLLNATGVSMSGTSYHFQLLPGAGGQTSVAGNGTLVVDGGADETLGFGNTGYTAWYAGAGTDTATLLSGNTEIVLDGAASDYTVASPSAGVVTVTRIDGSEGVKTIGVDTGTGELVFDDGAAIGLGITTDATNYAALGYDVFTIDDGYSTSTGVAGDPNLAIFTTGYAAPDGGWLLFGGGNNDVYFYGNGSGFNGYAELDNVTRVQLDGVTYQLDTMVGSYGGTDAPLTVGATPAGMAGTIVVDGPGSNAITIDNPGTTYWHVGSSDDTATLAAGTTDIYLYGPAAEYTVTSSGTTTTITDTEGGGENDVLTMAGGTGTLYFADGTTLALTSEELGTTGNDTFTIAADSPTIDGLGGTDTVVFSTSTAGPTNAWTIAENASGQVVVSGTGIGYTGIATLSNIEQLTLNGLTYALVTTPAAGGSTTIATPASGVSGTIVADGAGNDALTFSGTGTSYWYVGGGNNTATLSAGTTEIYLAGAASQYTESYDGTGVLTVTNTATGATETLTIGAGSGELVFGSGGNIALGTNATGDAVQYGGAINNTFTIASGAATIDGGGGIDTLYFSTTGANYPNQIWHINQTSAGQLIIAGLAGTNYTATATLTNVERLQMHSLHFNVIMIPYSGGTQTIGTNGFDGTLVVDGIGNDNLTFTDAVPVYWHPSSGTDTGIIDGGVMSIDYTGSTAQYSLDYDGNQLAVTDSQSGRNGKQTLTLEQGTTTLWFTDASIILSNTGATETGGAGNDTFTLASTASATINGAAGTDTVIFADATVAPTDALGIAENSAGKIVVTGTAAGYTGTATLSAIEQLTMGGSTYALVTTPNAGSHATIATPGAALAGSIVADGSGNDALTFDSTDTSYWYAGAGTDTALMSAGTTDVYFLGSSAQYSVTTDGNTIAVADSQSSRNGTKTFTVQGGATNLVFTDATLAYSSTFGSMTGTSGDDTFTLASGSQFIYGLDGTDTVVFSSSTSGPGQNWNISQDSSGRVLVKGAGSGYTGTATLTSIEQLTMNGSTYALVETPISGGNTTVGAAAAGLTGTIVTDGPSNDTLTFNGSGTSYWYAGAGTDTAATSLGTTDIIFQGSSSQYSLSYNGISTVTITDSQAARNGTKTVSLYGGTTTLEFADTSMTLSNTYATEVGGGGNDKFSLTNSQAVTINGGDGIDTVAFPSNDPDPYSGWHMIENSSGQVIITGASEGYTGTATLNSIEQVAFAGSTYALLTTPSGGGSLTIGSPGQYIAGNAIVDGAGNDTLTFSGTGASYWHVGAGNDTAAISAGTISVYFLGDSSQYSLSYSGSTVSIADSQAARSGVKTLTLTGGSTRLVFGATALTTLSNTGATEVGGAGSDTFTAGSAAATMTGGGGADTYVIGAGTTTETIVNGLSTSNAAAGTLDFTGSITSSNLWLQQSGNNLVIDVLGTTRQAVVQNWFASGKTYAQTNEIVDAQNLKLDSQVANLVQAMATFSAGNSAFNPQTTTNTSLADSSVYGTLATTDHNAWHS